MASGPLTHNRGQRDETFEVFRIHGLHLTDAGHETHYVLFGVVLSNSYETICVQGQRMLHQNCVEQACHVKTN